MNYMPLKLVTWEEYDNEISKAKSHLEEHGVLLWTLGVNIEHPLIAVKKMESTEIVAIMVSGGCVRKDELMSMIEKRGNMWYFKDGKYEGEPVMPSGWIKSDLESKGDDAYYLLITEIIDDLRINKDSIYHIDEETSSVKLNENWNQGAWIYLRLCG